MNGLALVGVGAGLVPLGLLLLLIVAVTGGRNEPDPAAERPAALYYSGVLFITLFTTLFAVFAVGASLMNLATHEHGGYAEYQLRTSEGVQMFGDSGGGEVVARPIPYVGRRSMGRTGENDDDWAAAVRGLVIAAVAGGVYLFHDRRRRLRRFGGVGQRVERTYLYVTAFVGIVIAVIAGGMALYNVFQVLAPGVAHAGTRADAAVAFGQTGLLALLAGYVFRAHLGDAEGGSASSASGGGGRSAVLVPEPPPPVLPDDAGSSPSAAPRKRAPAKKKAAAKKATAAKKRS